MLRRCWLIIGSVKYFFSVRCDLERTRLTEFRDLALTNFRRVSSEPNFFYSELRSKRIQKDYQKDFLLIELEMDSFSFFALKEKKVNHRKFQLKNKTTLVTWEYFLISIYSNFEFFALVSLFRALFNTKIEFTSNETTAKIVFIWTKFREIR